MREYLFFDNKKEKMIFKNKVNWIYGILAACMFVVALAIMEKDIILFFLLVFCGLLFFPVVPLGLKYYKKLYYIQLMDDYVLCNGMPNNLFGKKKISYQDVYYIETGRIEPVIYPRATTREQMVKEFGEYINIYDNNRKYLFSFRKNELVFRKIIEKNNNIEIIQCLNNYYL